MTAVVAVKVGDLVVAKVRGRRRTIEVDCVEGPMIVGRLPYANTYVAGAVYEGCYRGNTSCWTDEVVEVVRRAADA